MIQRIKHPLVPGLCVISVFILTILNVCRKLTGDLCKTKKKAPVDTRLVMHSTSLLWIKLCRESTSDDDSDDSDDADMYGCEYVTGFGKTRLNKGPLKKNFFADFAS